MPSKLPDVLLTLHAEQDVMGNTSEGAQHPGIGIKVAGKASGGISGRVAEWRLGNDGGLKPEVVGERVGQLRVEPGQQLQGSFREEHCVIVAVQQPLVAVPQRLHPTSSGFLMMSVHYSVLRTAERMCCISTELKIGLQLIAYSVKESYGQPSYAC